MRPANALASPGFAPKMGVYDTLVSCGVAVCTVLMVGSGALASPERPALTGIEVQRRADGVEIVVSGDLDTPMYDLRSSEGGRVVTLDVEGVGLPRGGVAHVGESPLVSTVSTSQTGRGVRLRLDLSQPVTYRARARKGRIRVRLEGVAPARSGRAGGAAPGRFATAPAPSQSGASAGPVQVRDVVVELRGGRERVVIELSRPARFRLVPGDVGPARMLLEDVVVADSVQRRTVPDGAEGARRVVRAVELEEREGRTVVTVVRRDRARGTAIREGDRIVWLFAPVTRKNSAATASRTVARERHADLGLVANVDGLSPMQVPTEASEESAGVERIDLDFKGADIHNILRLLAEVGGVNVVTSDGVSGSVTIRMRDVPWDQALQVILRAKGLGMVRTDNMIRVAPEADLEKERELAIARQKQRQQLAPLETRLIPISYAEAGSLQTQVKELLSSRGTTSVDERTNMLIVRDVVESLDDAEALVRSLDTQTPQVLVEARIVEANNNYLRDVGIQWGGDVSLNQAFGNQTGLVFPANVGVAGGASGGQSNTQGLSPLQGSIGTPNFAVNLPATAGDGVGGALGLSLGSVDGNFNLNVRLSAAEQAGSVKVISSPRILTLDNEKASIGQGTMIPYSKTSAQGVQTAFQQAQLKLEVTPHVTPDGAVAMEVNVTRDEPDFTRTSNQGDPAILKREAKTNLLVKDGETAVIGGIYTRNTGRNRDQVPILGDIPILGVLFQRRRVVDQRTELIIFLTPRIVNRAQAFALD